MTYTYTVTTYSYNCQVCGTRSSGVPRMSEIPRCLACNIALCKHCFQHGFCPAHWKQVPQNLQGPITDLHGKVERGKKLGFLGFFVFIAAGLGVLFGLVGEGEIAIGMPIFFVLLMFAIISITRAVSPVKRFRKKLLKYLAPYAAQSKGATGPATSTVPSQVASQPPPKAPAASKKICSHCGVAINADAVFCEKCGAKVE